MMLPRPISDCLYLVLELFNCFKEANGAILRNQKFNDMPIQKVCRSSRTGRFVSAKFAAKHKSTTQTESIKHKPIKKKK